MKAEILAALRETDGYISGQELCERFGVSRTAVWKAINHLKSEGYEIEAVTNRGYHIVSVPDVLSESELVSIRKTDWVGKRICYYDKLDSTNIQARRLAEEGAEHGTLVVAGRQEAGRGRRGRNWSSPPDTGIFMTLLLRPKIDPQNASMLTLVAAMAVTKAAKRLTDLEPFIKWPNDIVVNKKKVCGILTEMNAQIDYVDYIVVGIGINVNNKSFSEEISLTATSLFLEGGSRINRASLIAAVCEEFEIYYNKYILTQDLSDIVEEYNRYLVNRNEKVRVMDFKEPYEGTALGITMRGELIVDTGEEERLVSSGEVSVRGIYGYV